ncbi:murein L,D-transpeptidase catalytic domain-containing protein, partial [Pseudomonas aeruginosa]|uniref:murein L,D-transpeptidase catalytic domain-containing protein n=1 Tax=Pseudomonas aeruginosa TaxID=287 RepID=UPI00211A6B48
VETAATQYQLLDLGLLRGQLRLQLAVPAALLLDLAPHLLARACHLPPPVPVPQATPPPTRPAAYQSSIGLFQTGQLYTGKHGQSLRLVGLEPGFNDKSEERAIVM